MHSSIFHRSLLMLRLYSNELTCIPLTHSLTRITLTRILTHSSVHTHLYCLHSLTRILTHSSTLTNSLTHSHSTHSLTLTHSHHMHSLTFMCMYILCRYIRMLTVINTFWWVYYFHYFRWVLFYKEYLSVLTVYHQTIEHCKIWY